MTAFILFDKLVDCLESNTLIVKNNIFLIESLMIGWYIQYGTTHLFEWVFLDLLTIWYIGSFQSN
jgi:hypothetical protein